MSSPRDGGTAGFEVVASEPVYDGRIISVRVDTLRMPDGATARREIVDHPGAVVVVAIDDEGRIVMVNQFRPAVGRNLDELPAGLLDIAGEPAVTGAQRELAEEAGLAASDWAVLLDLNPSVGFSNEAVRVFLARGLSDAPAPEGFEREHEEAEMTATRIPLDEAVRQVQSGAITNAAAAAGILAAARSRDAGWTGVRPADSPWPDRPGR